MYYSPSENAFFSTAVFGEKTLKVIDPSWVPGKLDIELLPGGSTWDYDGELVTNSGEEPITVTIADSTIKPGLVDVVNPDCKLPPDALKISLELYNEMLDAQTAGKVIEAGPDGLPTAVDKAPPSFDQMLSIYTAVVQKKLDEVAKALGYDDLNTAVTYAEEPSVPKFQAEGKALRAWRSLVWAKCYEMLGLVKNGKAKQPSVAELVNSLPEFTNAV